jgi:hypothetical protein
MKTAGTSITLPKKSAVGTADSQVHMLARSPGKDRPMFSDITEPVSDGRDPRPLITSYDSGYEHSFEHYAEVRQLVEEAHEEFMKAVPEAEERITALAS